MTSQAFWGLTRYTLREAMYSRSLFVVAALVTLYALYLGLVGGWTGGVTALHRAGEEADLHGRLFLYRLSSMVNFLTLFGMSRIVPRMIDFGGASFFLARPYSRTVLLSCKLLTINLAFAVILGVSAGAMVAIDQFTGALNMSVAAAFTQWGLEFLVFAVYSPLLIFFNLQFRSSALAVMGCFAIWLTAYALVDRTPFLLVIDKPIVTWFVDAAYYILPKSREISTPFLMNHYNWTPLWSSLGFAGVMYLSAVWKFRRMDF